MLEKMRWIRQHIRSAAWLALAALAVHVVVTFGHMHAEWFATPTAGATALAAAELQAPDKAKGAGGPTQPHRVPRVDNFCAVCASIGLLGALVLPAAQKLAPARVIVRISEANSADTNTAARLRSSSPARAPPAA
jgi:hypothetical protein